MPVILFIHFFTFPTFEFAATSGEGRDDPRKIPIGSGSFRIFADGDSFVPLPDISVPDPVFEPSSAAAGTT